MAVLKHSDLKKQARTALADRGRKLQREHRVYRVQILEDGLKGLVLSDLQPEETELFFERKALSWKCSCLDAEPCVHFFAMVAQAEASGVLPLEALEAFRPGGAAKAAVAKKAAARSYEGEFDFFDPEPAQPSLFDEAADAAPAEDPETFVLSGMGPGATFLKEGPAHRASPPELLPLQPADASRLAGTRAADGHASGGPDTGTPMDEGHRGRLPDPGENARVASQWADVAHPWERTAREQTRQAQVPESDLLFESHAPRFQLQFAETLGRTDIRLVVRYGDITMAPTDHNPVYTIPGTRRAIRRDLEAERAFRDRLAAMLEGKLAWERGPYAPLVGNDVPDWGLLMPLGDFLVETGYDLMRQGFDILVFGRKILGTASLAVKCEQDMDWFGVSARVKLDAPEGGPSGGTAEAGEAAESGGYSSGLQDLLDLALDKSPVPGLVSTKEGYVALRQSDLRRLAFLQKWGMDNSGALTTSAVNLSLIDTLYEQLENKDDEAVRSSHQALEEISIVLDAAYRSAHAHGTADEDADPESHGFHIPQQPAGLQATLRLYQLIGFAWLRTLHRHGYGACLADDMGLGKTMQTLSLLLSLKEEGILGPSLLVSPVVTLSNWESEIRRWAPSLTFVRHQGTRRIQDAAELRRHDLVIVSYQTLRNDLDLFASHEWDCIILDEAHYIKTATSQVFKAVRVLSGRHRISLTGTPIENNTMELWAQFSFLNPGLLGSIEEFQEQFASPIERKNDDTAAQVLRETVRPFILRRKKTEVLKELPEKLESVHWVDMDAAQAELYEAHRKRYQEIVLGLLDSQGVEKSRMEVFKYLLRLRQLAIAPVLADDSFAAVPSAKLDALMLMLEDLVTEDNKVLVFSQFTSTLDLIGERLAERSWKYAYLSGATKDRGAVIETFKSEADRKIFLLSLKAGGVGINLTQANYVVLFDPWWNPAAENQAVDRAYRMGQNRNVSAYKFITRGTIEEKILALQSRKTLLSEAIVNPSGASLVSLDDETVRNLFA